MNCVERALSFRSGEQQLIGVISTPAEGKPRSGVGLVVVVGGPQYRVGSHRQFALLARALAAAGHATLRFDYQGMGDSGGEMRDFLQAGPDIGPAIDALMAAVPELRSVALWGLCDGASAALLYLDAAADARVCGLCLLNPWARSAQSLAKAHVKHYYLDRLRQREFWLKLASGKVAGAALAGLWQNLRLAMVRRRGPGSDERLFQVRMADAWRGFPGAILLLLSGNDYTAREFQEYTASDPAWRGLLEATKVQIRELPGADHTFSDAADRERVEQWTLQWLRTLHGAG